jgi:quinol monooxygenase YgiN
MAELTVIARVKAKPGKESELEQALRGAVAPTHAEAGCLRYALHRSLDDPATFLFVERWVSREALDQHLETPHLKAIRAKFKDLLEARDVGLYELLPEGTPQKRL